LLAPAIWFLALFIREHALVGREKLRSAIIWTTIAVATGMLVYSLAIIPFLQRREKVRPIGEQITAAIPPNETLYAVGPDYQPYLFYVQRPIAYLSHVNDLPASAHYVLVQPKNETEVEQSALWLPLHAQPLLRISDYRNHKIILFRVGSESSHRD